MNKNGNITRSEPVEGEVFDFDRWFDEVVSGTYESEHQPADEPESCIAMSRYVDYVLEWAASHRKNVKPSSPLSYEEWEILGRVTAEEEGCATVKRVLRISNAQIRKYSWMMREATGNYAVRRIQPFDIVARWEADYGDGYTVVIGVFSGYDGEPLWSQAILYLNGTAVQVSEDERELEGTWMFSHNNTTFVLELQAA